MRNWGCVSGKEARKRSRISLDNIMKKEVEKNLTEVDKCLHLVERMMKFINHPKKSYKVGMTRSERICLEKLAANPPNLRSIN